MTGYTEVRLKHNGELAIVRATKDGIVEVEREGNKTRLSKPMDNVLTNFVEHGWEPESTEETKENNSIQREVDAYLKLHTEHTKLKAEMDALKKKIRAYMDENNIERLEGTDGREIYLQDAKASNATSIYTDYELSDIMQELEGDLLRKVTEIRVNAEKLEGLLKVEKLPKDKVSTIKALKIVKQGTPRFKVTK